MKKERALKQQKQSNLTIILLFILFSSMFIITPYYRGLFFHEDFYGVNLYIQLIFLVSLVFCFKKFVDLLNNNLMLSITLILIPGVYTAAYWYSSFPVAAANEAFQWFAYILVFILVFAYTYIESNVRHWLVLLFWLTVIWIVGLVYLVQWGFVEFPDALLGSTFRFSSVFQYANTLAAIISAFILGALLILVKRMRISVQLLLGLPLIPIMLAFFLTNSRGGMLVFALGWLIGHFFLSWKEQIIYNLYTLFLIATSLIGLSIYNGSISSGETNLGIVTLICLSVFFTVLVFLIQHFIQKNKVFDAPIRYSFIFPLVLIVGGISLISLGRGLLQKALVLLPETLQQRISTINFEQHEVQERFIFYKDALKVWQEHMWFGAGGGGWRALFESFKSLPYYSTQAHSFYMQILIEVGLIGSIIVLGFIFYVICKGIWMFFMEKASNERTYLSPAILVSIVFMIHNAIDFNMSFGTYNIFLFSLLALIWSYIYDKKWLSNIFKLKNPESIVGQRNAIVYALIGVIVLSSFYTTYKSYAYGQAENLFFSAQQNGDLNAALNTLDKAIFYHKNEPKFKELKIIMLMHAYQQTGNREWLDKVEGEYVALINLQPSMYMNHLKYAEFLWNYYDEKDALNQLQMALQLAPWQQLTYEENVKYRLEYLLENREAKTIESAKEEQDYLRLVLEQIERKLEVQNGNLPKGLRLTNPIILNDENQLLFAKALYFLGEYSRSLNYLQGIDLEQVSDEDIQKEVLLLSALNYQWLDENQLVAAILSNDLAVKLNLANLFDQIHNDPEWSPFLD